MKMRAATVAGLLALSVAAACGGDDGDEAGDAAATTEASPTTEASSTTEADTGDSAPSTGAPETEPETTGGTEEAADPAPRVEIVDFAYEPATVTVAAGTEVAFENADATAHTATADDGAFDTGQIAATDSATVTLDTPGEITYHCDIHPDMTGTVTVTDG